MPYRRFLPWSIAGGVLWGTGSAMLGYVAGGNFERVVKWMGRAGLILFGAVVLGGLGVFLYLKLRRPQKKKT
jgi:membrane protein DedA with SNARE-associated domain